MKSTFGPSELAIMEPELLVFLRTDRVVLPEFPETTSGRPSPSRSPRTIPNGADPVVKSTFGAREDEIIFRELGNVTINGAFENAVNPLAESVTEMGAKVVPYGTETESDDPVPPVTKVRTAPR